MTGNFAACVAFTLAPQQDGQPIHITPGDRGGATAWGITRATLSRWRRLPCSNDDVAGMAIVEAQEIYQAWYWDTVCGDSLPIGADLMVFDHGVVAGEGTSSIVLQRALMVTPDGHIGPKTLKAAAAAPPSMLVSLLRTAQERDFRSKADFHLFGNGWLNRLQRRHDAAQAMIAAKAKPASPSA